jgi:mannose-6-phosphate isomerase
MDVSKAGLLAFDEGYFERIWGGRKLETVYGKPLPPGKSIGEAWLISDHPRHTSVVSSGPFEGHSLGALLKSDPQAILGSRPTRTRHGLFPLLLKLLDSADYLSIQVHPDDAQAERHGELNGGKTEMWHVLSSSASSEVICGLAEGITRDDLQAAIKDGSVSDRLAHFEVAPGSSVFLPAGTVHAIGKDIVLAEIQQNSDITYRLYDWGRLQADGTARELHIDKSLAVTAFADTHQGVAIPLRRAESDVEWTVLTACEFFAADRVAVNGVFHRTTRKESFHLLLCIGGGVTVAVESDDRSIRSGEAVMVIGASAEYSVAGHGIILDYYVPNIESDIAAPLQAAGHSAEAIASLGLG